LQDYINFYYEEFLNMNICICTVPLRPNPTDFPPFGSMAIIQSLRKVGMDVNFYNIDYHRYKHEEIEAHFKEQQFDIVGISAVVSTGYVFVKYLSKLIRQVSPNTIIIVGGNLAASAEILLRKCEVDYCVAGDGELIIRDLLQVLHEKPLNYDMLRATKGICFLDEHDKFRFTGYGAKPSVEEIEFPDYGILEEEGSLPHFITDNVAGTFYGYKGEIEKGKTVATLMMAKGCVARCTFCHRWEQGFRVLPTDRIIENVRKLIEQYNVGYVQVSDENFGADRKAAWEIASQLGELGVKWNVAGVRTSTVTKESLQHWKDNGCTAVIYGIESGSRKILEIMEKRTTIEKNINALKWAGEAGLYTMVQLVIGMPGEDDQTIFETIDFLKEVSPSIIEWNNRVASDLISINYLQALPGTPVYEFAREHGLIGRSIDKEEEYLMGISNIDAYSHDHFVNMTGLPLLKVLMWRSVILAYLDFHQYHARHKGEVRFSLLKVVSYYAKMIWRRIGNRLNKLRSKKGGERKPDWQVDYVRDSGYFNISSG
jgi:anaerobic magnesium-protoporphyrin IX monomethyl ester cyclase